MDEVMTEAAAAVAAPRVTLKACSLQAYFWRSISRLVLLLLSVSVSMELLSSRECNFPAFVRLLNKSTGSFLLPRTVRMDDLFDRRGGDSGNGGDGDDGMTRGFPLLLLAVPVVDSLPSIDVLLWTMLLTLGEVTTRFKLDNVKRSDG